ncbi:hypothetical protein BLNAU_15041 [Blattamonas nauphoetae]|uniref:RanBP2-type domain-containing protein n=1 Tax=Blattamonas nauphoetae TaxID=2049346 RepID=A0ABQ9XIA0_9EUKA|nr:hypothetical protein BLNAU_15041 [Blattamonas nauphoetae]
MGQEMFVAAPRPTNTLIIQDIPSTLNSSLVKDGLSDYGPIIELRYVRDDYRTNVVVELQSMTKAKSCLEELDRCIVLDGISYDMMYTRPLSLSDGLPTTATVTRKEALSMGLKPKKRKWKTDWQCPKCFVTNAWHRKICSQCKEPKEGDEDSDNPNLPVIQHEPYQRRYRSPRRSRRSHSRSRSPDRFSRRREYRRRSRSPGSSSHGSPRRRRSRSNSRSPSDEHRYHRHNRRHEYSRGHSYDRSSSGRDDSNDRDQSYSTSTYGLPDKPTFEENGTLDTNRAGWRRFVFDSRTQKFYDRQKGFGFDPKRKVFFSLTSTLVVQWVVNEETGQGLYQKVEEGEQERAPNEENAANTVQQKKAAKQRTKSEGKRPMIIHQELPADPTLASMKADRSLIDFHTLLETDLPRMAGAIKRLVSYAQLPTLLTQHFARLFPESWDTPDFDFVGQGRLLLGCFDRPFLPLNYDWRQLSATKTEHGSTMELAMLDVSRPHQSVCTFCRMSFETPTHFKIHRMRSEFHRLCLTHTILLCQNKGPLNVLEEHTLSYLLLQRLLDETG